MIDRLEGLMLILLGHKDCQAAHPSDFFVTIQLEGGWLLCPVAARSLPLTGWTSSTTKECPGSDTAPENADP